MITISVQTFDKLAQESVELIKAKETIVKLETIIRKTANKNRVLIKQMQKDKSSHISVCIFIILDCC